MRIHRRRVIVVVVVAVVVVVVVVVFSLPLPRWAVLLTRRYEIHHPLLLHRSDRGAEIPLFPCRANPIEFPFRATHTHTHTHTHATRRSHPVPRGACVSR